MKPLVTLAACLVATLCAVASIPLMSAQTSSPSAYVYLINRLSPTTSAAELNGYSADSNGSLTRLSGSPFWTGNTQNGFALAHTAHWLFFSDGVSIYSFSIASNGSLKLASSVNAQQYSKCQCGEIAGLVLDRTGSTLYALSFYDDGSNNVVQFYDKNNTTGALTYFGSTPETIEADVTPFLGNNEYGYSTGCAQGGNFGYSVHRNSDGSLTEFFPSQQIPQNPNGHDYCTGPDSPYSTNNLAMALLPDEAPPAQLAVYTADSSGNLSTNSTAENMPSSAVGWPRELLTSPAGNLLAVAGQSGLQVFHVNGSNPITSYTGLIAAHDIYEVAWDSNNHLFAIGSGKVNAFRITSTGYKQASGSPYAINAEAITVLSLTSTSACAPPSTAGVKICSPANGSTDSSPVGVSAAATASSGLHITATRLYVDSKSVFTSSGNTLNTSVSMSAGTHHLTVVGYESNSSSLTANETITVK